MCKFGIAVLFCTILHGIACAKGGEELLLAHGLPIEAKLAKRLGVPLMITRGLSLLLSFVNIRIIIPIPKFIPRSGQV